MGAITLMIGLSLFGVINEQVGLVLNDNSSDNGVYNEASRNILEFVPYFFVFAVLVTAIGMVVRFINNAQNT